MDIVFSHPEYFYLVLIVTILTFFAYLSYLYRLKHFYATWGRVSGYLLKFSWLTLRSLMVTISVGLLALALLGAHIQEKSLREETEPAEIQFAIDCSLSMLAEDAQLNDFPRPLSRLEAVKLEIGDFIKTLNDQTETFPKGRQELQNDWLGIVAFADMGLRVIPIPTRDEHRFFTELNRLDENYVKMGIPQGTNIWDGISQAIQNFSPESESENLQKILVVLSDGEPQAEDEYLERSQGETLELLAAEKNLYIVIIGIGDPSRDTPIPKTKDWNGNINEYYTEEEPGPNFGKIIWTRPRPDYLEWVAETVGGAYHHSRDVSDVSKLLKTFVEGKRVVIRSVEAPLLKDISFYFVLTAFFLLLIAVAIKI